MFRGTKRLPDQTFNRLTEEHGAVSNAYTTYNETGYYEFSDIAKLELMMAMEAERMSGLEMDEAALPKSAMWCCRNGGSVLKPTRCHCFTKP